MNHITFLNHSSLLVTSKKTKILCDPWFFGSAFQDGWSLLHDQSHDINDLEFEYVWISHEHPDHFSIPTISALKRKTKFLYQKTEDKKVKNFLETKGHEVIEIEHGKKTLIGDIELVLFVCDGYDSSVLFKFDDGRSFLNINDARVDLDRHLENEIMPHLVNTKLDMVSFQFSYANWAGNQGDQQISRHQQQIVDQKNIYVLETLKPKECILMASFVYFSHEENFYWNDNFYLNHALMILENLNLDTKVTIPKVNQKFDLNSRQDELGHQNNNKIAINFWSELHKSAEINFRTESIYDLQKLEEAYFDFYQRVSSKNIIINSLKDIFDEKNLSLNIYLSDIDKMIRISLLSKNFFVFEDRSSREFDISVSSETFNFLMKNNFARGTIGINSRIIFNYDNAYKFFLFFFIPYSNNIGRFYNDNNLFIKDIKSIEKTAIMMSILKFNDKSRINLDKAINA